MKKIYLVDESLNEFAGRRGRPPKEIEPEIKDDWYSSEDEFDSNELGPEQIEDVDIADEVSDLAIQKILRKRLENELSGPEFNRVSIKFRTPSGEISGVPMAKLSGDAFLMKTPNGMKKVKVSDMIAESEELKKYVSESFKDYE